MPAKNDLCACFGGNAGGPDPSSRPRGRRCHTRRRSRDHGCLHLTPQLRCNSALEKSRPNLPCHWVQRRPWRLPSPPWLASTATRLLLAAAPVSVCLPDGQTQRWKSQRKRLGRLGGGSTRVEATTTLRGPEDLALSLLAFAVLWGSRGPTSPAGDFSNLGRMRDSRRPACAIEPHGVKTAASARIVRPMNG